MGSTLGTNTSHVMILYNPTIIVLSNGLLYTYAPSSTSRKAGSRGPEGARLLTTLSPPLSHAFSRQLFYRIWQFAMAGNHGGSETIQAKRHRASVTPRAV